MNVKNVEWLIDEEDDESFVALCPDEIERNLPDGSLSFSSGDENKRVKKTFLIKNSERIVKPTKGAIGGDKFHFWENFLKSVSHPI